jgi:hypothetical protein
MAEKTCPGQRTRSGACGKGISQRQLVWSLGQRHDRGRYSIQCILMEFDKKTSQNREILVGDVKILPFFLNCLFLHYPQKRVVTATYRKNLPDITWQLESNPVKSTQ